MSKRLLVTGILLIISLVVWAGCGNGGGDAVYKDGTYTAVSQASRGYVEVKVTVAGDDITGVEIVEYNDLGVAKDYATYGGENFKLLEEAHTTLAERIVEADTWEVDAFTGATGTSNKVLEAAKFALEKAKINPEVSTTYFDGTFMAISDKTERGWGTALVTIENDKIVAVELNETTNKKDADGNTVPGEYVMKSDDYPHEPYHTAKVDFAEAIVKAQSTEGVDTITDATGSCDKWLQAVQRALDAAKVK